MTRRCHNDPTSFINFLDTTGTSRRHRTRRARAREASRERAEESAYLTELSIAQQLGHIARPTIQQPHERPFNDQEAHFEPQIGSYQDPEIDGNQEILPSAAHAAYFRSRRYAEHRERMSQRWSELEEMAAAAFFECQKTYSNWTTLPSNYDLPLNSCKCTAAEICTRKVDLIDIIGRSTTYVPFCKCTSDVVRLIYYGYIASSPDKPRTAFSIRLIQFHHLLWQSSVLSASSFVKALSCFLDTRSKSPLYARGLKYKKRDLRIPFSYSVDLYSRIILIQKTVQDDVLNSSSADRWASKCSRCFGPKEGEIKTDPSEPDVIVALDGNFQQRHYAYASKDNPDEEKYPKSFVRPSKIAADAVLFTATDSAAVGIDPPCSDTHKAANDTRNETTWEKCDDNGLFASTCRHDIPLLFVNIFKTGEKLYYPISIIQHLLDEFPQDQIGILYDLGCHLEAHIRKLHQTPNAATPGQNYSDQFFEEQWQEEKSYHLNADTTERHQVELGHLLCLEEELNSAWSTVPMTPDQVIVRINTLSTVQRKLAAQREIVGNTGVADGLSVEQQDQLKMIWYLKTELRKSFLALVEEKQPLLRVCRAGDSSTLGTRGQQKLQEALRKRAGKLCTVLEKYNSHIEAFLVSNPNRPAPPIIEYCELLGLQPEDNFWNDGLFTNAHEPWAVDPLTQQGIRHLESYKRAVEEKRCLGWEVRRAMRWATKQNDDHLEILLALFELSRNPQEEVPTALQPLLRHQYLDHQSLESKIKSSLVVLHLGLIRICNLQLDWNRHIIGVIEGTEAQAGDTILVTKWISQVERIKYATTKGLLSQIPGELNEAAVRFLAGFEVINHPTDPSASSSNQNNSVPPTTPEGDINPRNEPSPSGRVTAESQESNGLAERNDLEDQSDEDAEGEEDTYLEDMEGILAETMQADLEQEHGVRIGQHHFVDQMMN
ncbi:hypothetical protein PTTG_11734 [Puccinia triticina 1-1 BBBD Race 1]|uniref:CxC1 domain-containing protein n=1 Tax=Puccinia triticina (isolate 1-1 / race 1 (BBBD)) TaxID=630390 RepID=A0A180H4L0_PUCT1|nr:hypothetical protein PTTG_11734 [Puccinia triticina 1-1 BBBD Race 1]